MMNIINSFKNNSEVWNIIFLVVILVSIIYAMYTRIKYLCLKKAAEKVAEVEKIENLTGEQKFDLVILWIEKDLPNIFKSTFAKVVLEKLVQLAYNNASDYAKNYIKRKTGYDISKIIENLSVTSDDSSDDTKSDSSTSN